MRERLWLALLQNLILVGLVVGGFELPYLIGSGR
jgi:hypothetical protein